MSISEVRFGTDFLFYGSILHCLSIFGIELLPRIPFFQPVASILMIAGGIFSNGFEEFDDYFLKLVGISMYCVGACYQCKSLWTPFYYGWCGLGGFLAMGGILLGYFKEGQPTLLIIGLQFCFSLLIYGHALSDILMQPGSVYYFCVVLPLGLQNCLLLAILFYFRETKGLWRSCGTRKNKFFLQP